MKQAFIDKLEKEFDIYISDELANSLDNPEQFAKYIDIKYSQRIDDMEGGNEVGFFRLREMLIKTFGFKKVDLKPDTKTSKLLKGNIRKKWGKLNKALDNKLHYHSLEILPIVKYTLMFLGVIFAIWGIYDVVVSSKKEVFGETLGVIAVIFIFYVFLLTILRPIFGKKVPNSFEELKFFTYLLSEPNQIYKYRTYEDILQKIIEIEKIMKSEFLRKC